LEDLGTQLGEQEFALEWRWNCLLKNDS
jgi:hypothetical protein